HWAVHIDNNRMTVTRPYDGEVMEGIWLRETVANRHGRAYEAKVDERMLEVTVAHQLCEDTMAGAQYPAQVRLTIDGNTFDGCGGDRQRLLQGAQWVVEDLAGKGIIDRSLMTIRFFGDNRVARRASCNRLLGRSSSTGESRTFGGLGTPIIALQGSF